jgi:hypothetical protein
MQLIDRLAAIPYTGAIGDILDEMGHARQVLPRTKLSPALDPKLPKMMVQMLVHQDRPFHRSQRPEKEVRMLRAYPRPARCKAVYRFAQPLPLRHEIPFIRHQAALLGYRIAAHRCPVHDQRLLRQPPQQSSNQDSRRTYLPHRHLHRRRAMRQRLRWIHLAPQPLAIRSQPRHPLLHFFHRRRFKEIFHPQRSSPVNPSQPSVSEHPCRETTVYPVIIVCFLWSSSAAVLLSGRSNPCHQTVPESPPSAFAGGARQQRRLRDRLEPARVCST